MSMALPAQDGGQPETIFALIPAQTEGVTVHPFWGTDILAGAESDEVRLTDVFVDDQLTVPANNDGGALDLLQTIGFVWFELLITSCYLGAATALAEQYSSGAAPRRPCCRSYRCGWRRPLCCWRESLCICNTKR